MKRSMLTKIFGTLFVGVAAVVAVISMSSSPADGQSNTAETQGGGNNAVKAPAPVGVTKPPRRSLTRGLTMPATLRADEQVDMLAKTSGYVAEIAVDIGSRVSKGDLLIVIDVPEMMDELRQAQAIETAKWAKVTQAEALRETAKAEVQRFTAEYALKKLTNDRKVKLRQQNAIPEQELDEAKNQLVVAGLFRPSHGPK